MNVRVTVVLILAALILGSALIQFYWLTAVFAALLIMALIDITQRKHTILRNYPLLGHIRYFMEFIRPEIQQYFVESNLSGRPINREYRELVYQRSKQESDTRPFGTQFDVYRTGYEWMSHSLHPIHIENKNPRVKFGGPDCTLPYMASPLNISAMSYGALSKNAVLALNKGAKEGGFAHNTGEGGLSPYHLEYGADVIWQIGTGYFGCRTESGGFDANLFSEKATLDVVKMIEIKLSQGAKPGHGGILPAAKLTKEIAEIRHVPLGKDVISPAAHSAFDSPIGLLMFVKQLRKLSGGKPVGFKLCIGQRHEFLAICKAMLDTGITPDFITVDGSEGGTGAAPIEFTNSVGMPLTEAVVFVNNALIGIGVRDKIRIIAAAKIFSAFHIAKVMALGADTVNSARGMMLALGCIHARNCNNDKCPTGITTQNPNRYKLLDIDLKGTRVFNFHKAMITNLLDLVGACGINDLSQITRSHVNRRVSATEVKTYHEIYPLFTQNCLLDINTIPELVQQDWQRANSSDWAAVN